LWNVSESFADFACGVGYNNLNAREGERRTMNSDIERQVLTISDVAKALGVCPRAVTNYLDDGLLPYVVTGRRCGRRILKSDLEAFLSNKRYGKLPPKKPEAIATE
jgi:excisionase family DNA binding protein